MNTTRVENLLQMINDDPEDPFLRYGFALEYASDNQYIDKAIELFSDLYRSRPDYLPVYYQLSVLLRKQGDGLNALEVAKAGMVVARAQGNRHAYSELESLVEDLD